MQKRLFPSPAKRFLRMAVIAVVGIHAASAQTIQVLKSLKTTDGIVPQGGVILASDGKIYGTVSGGSDGNSGGIFRMNPDGTGYQVIYSFVVAATGGTVTSDLLEGSDGRLYGTCSAGGPNNAGTIWRIDKNGQNFTPLVTPVAMVDGSASRSGLIKASNGRLYGTFSEGGTNSAGSIFSLDESGSDFQVLHAFASASDGKTPDGSLWEGSDGRIYGVTATGGPFNFGTIYRMDKDGSNFTVLHAFASDESEGSDARGGLVQSGGWLLGSTREGGANDEGTLFRLSLEGTNFSVTHDFAAMPAPNSPQSRLTPGGDGWFYGTAGGGGASGAGAIYRVDLTGSNFQSLVDFENTNGLGPFPALYRVSPGMFLGATLLGGSANSNGVIYRFSIPIPAATVSLRGKKKITTSGRKITLRGTSTDAASVQVKVGKAAYRPCRTVNPWSFKAKLAPGRNVVMIRAINAAGIASRQIRVLAIRR